MKKEIDNTSKPVLQTDEQVCKDDNSTSTVNDNTRSMQRRRLLKGLGAAPIVMTLHNGAAMAASSSNCIGHQEPPDIDANGCIEGTAEDHDSFLRVEVGKEEGPMLGRAEGYDWQPSGRHPYFKEQYKDRNLCLVSVDAETGEIHTDRVEPSMLTSNSCWASFT